MIEIELERPDKTTLPGAELMKMEATQMTVMKK